MCRQQPYGVSAGCRAAFPSQRNGSAEPCWACDNLTELEEVSLDSALSVVAAGVVFVFAAVVTVRWRQHPTWPLGLWGVGLLMYGVAALMEALFAISGWHPAVFRTWYLVGAVLVAAWLGQGTVYLLVSGRVGRVRIAHLLLALLVAGSLFAAARVFSADLDPLRMLGREMSGDAIVTPGVRVLTPLFNVYGSLFLVGGALYSGVAYLRRGRHRHRAIGNLLIAVGAMAPALGGSLQRFGLASLLALSHLVGAVLMFAGFLYSSRPEDSNPATRSRRSLHPNMPTR